MRTGKIHAPKRVTERIERFASFLLGRGERGATTDDIYEGTHLRAISAVASEARALGFVVDCKPERSTHSGCRVYRYWIRSAARVPSTPAGELFA